MRVVAYISVLVLYANGYPMQYQPIQYIPQGYPTPVGQQRIFWSSLGDFIQSSDFFPIEFNVPDTISTISTGVSSFAGNIAQRIPIINRWTNPNTPRPLRFVLVPIMDESALLDNRGYLGQNQLQPTPVMQMAPPSQNDLSLIQKLLNKISPAKGLNTTTENCTESVGTLKKPDYKKERDALLQYLELMQEHTALENSYEPWGFIPQIGGLRRPGFRDVFNSKPSPGKYGLFYPGGEGDTSKVNDEKVENNRRSSDTYPEANTFDSSSKEVKVSRRTPVDKRHRGRLENPQNQN